MAKNKPKGRSDKNRAMFVISVAAEMAGMHPQTLRIYERRGLLEPSRTPGGTRRYSLADIERLELIQQLTEQGLNLEGVKQVLALREEVVKLQREIERLQSRIDELKREADRKVRELERSYRSEIVVWSRNLPDVRRRP